MTALLVCLRSMLDKAPEQVKRGRWRWEAGAKPLAAAALLLAGCSGVIGTPGGGSGTSGPGGSTGGLLGGGGAPPVSFRPAPATLRRLTVAQYQNSVRDLFGRAITPPTDLEPGSQNSVFASIAAARVAVSAHATEQFETAPLA